MTGYRPLVSRKGAIAYRGATIVLWAIAIVYGGAATILWADLTLASAEELIRLTTVLGAREA